MLQVTQGGSTTESYSYDAVGNRLSSSGVPTYSYNPSNELTSNSSGSYTYDNNGNTLTDASGKSYTWDFENQLVSVVVPGTGTVAFKYDPLGRRIQKSSTLGTTSYLYDGVNLISEMDNAASVLARYTQDLGIDTPLSMLRSGTGSYYEQDGLGSVTSLSNSTGSLVNTYTYDSFGRMTASTGAIVNPLGYTAREFDLESGNYYYRARYFDQNAGRFVGEDPKRLDAGINFYTYVSNNPLNTTDPLGLCAPDPKLKACLDKILSQPVDKVKIKTVSAFWQRFYLAETRRDLIKISIPCDDFLSDNLMLLEEYYHVLYQWDTGRMGILNYLWDSRNGYDKNPFEIEAKQFARDHAEELKKCRDCKQ